MCEGVETKTGTGRGSGRQGRQGARCVQWKQWKPKGFQAVEAGDTCVLSERVNRLHASLQVLYIHLCSICSIHMCSICSICLCSLRQQASLHVLFAGWQIARLSADALENSDCWRDFSNFYQFLILSLEISSLLGAK